VKLIHEVAYGESSPYGSSFYAEDLNFLTPESVLTFRAKQYLSGNITVISSGVPHEAISALAECYLHRIPVGKSTVPKATYIGGEMKVRSKAKGASYAGVAFPIDSQNKGMR